MHSPAEGWKKQDQNLDVATGSQKAVGQNVQKIRRCDLKVLATMKLHLADGGNAEYQKSTKTHFGKLHQQPINKWFVIALIFWV